MSKRGRPSAGSITQRGSSFRSRITIDGVTYDRVHATRPQAENWLVAMRNGVRDPEFAQAIAEAQTLTLSGAMLQYLDCPKKRHGHPAKDRSRTLQVIALGGSPDVLGFVHRPLTSINTMHIQQYIDVRLEQDVSPSTVNRELNIISRAFSFAAADLNCIGLANPVVKSVRLREPPGRERRLRKDEQALLFSASEQYEIESAVPLRAFIAFAADTAMRFGEIVQLRWEDIDWEGGVILIHQSKNGTRRSVPMVEDVVELLERLGPKHRGMIWPKAEAIRSAWRRVREIAAMHAESIERDPDLAERLKTLRIHDLRHEGVSRWVERTDFSILEIMQITGHKSPTMVLRYTHANGLMLSRRLKAYQGISLSKKGMSNATGGRANVELVGAE